MSELTIEDLNVLIEAVDDWEKEKNREAIFSMTIGAMFTPKEQVRSFIEDEERKFEARKGSQKLRSEQAILIKSKLIQIRRGLEDKQINKELNSIKVQP